MITKKENADGTITITTDAATAEILWIHAYLMAEDDANSGHTRGRAREIANALQDDLAWKA